MSMRYQLSQAFSVPNIKQETKINQDTRGCIITQEPSSQGDEEPYFKPLHDIPRRGVYFVGYDR